LTDGEEGERKIHFEKRGVITQQLKGRDQKVKISSAETGGGRADQKRKVAKEIFK